MGARNTLMITGVILIALVCSLSFAEEEATTKAPSTSEQGSPAPATPEQAAQLPPTQETATESEIQWVWGETVAIDIPNKAITVKYFDYDSDSEKEIKIIVDDKTNYENVKSIEEIKPKDTLSIDYIAGSEGKLIAKNISVEKAEGVQAPLPEETTTPEPKASETPKEQ
jgi:hypothetical protein